MLQMDSSGFKETEETYEFKEWFGHLASVFCSTETH